MLLTGENEDAESITKLYDGFKLMVHHLEKTQR